MTAHSDALRRRNGRLQACDPCRSRKVSCDHNQPICGRCQGRRQGSQCVYTISSHSVRSSPSSQTAETRPPPHRRRHQKNKVSPLANASSASAVLTPDEDQTDPESSHSGTPKPTRDSTTADVPVKAPRQTGYLGYTSYSAVFNETSNRLSCLRGEPSLSAVPDNGSSGIYVAAAAISPLTREMCLVVLRAMSRFDKSEVEDEISPSPHEGWIQVLSSRLLTSYKRFAAGFRRGHGERHLEEMAEVLCRNTSKPVTDRVANFEEWVEQYSGENMRWEALGLIFTIRDYACRTRFFDNECILLYTGLCIDLTKKFSDANLLQLFVLFRRMIIESNTGAGDTGLACWRAHAETVSTLTFLGIHADCETNHDYTPTFVSELRRRIFSMVFNIDKVCSSFQGRPPLLSYYYVSCCSPLDIPDEYFIGDESSFREGVLMLNADGSNNTGRMGHATHIRAREKIAYIKDELMGMALRSTEALTIEQILDMKARAVALFDSFPPIARFDCEKDENLSAELAYCRLLIRVEYLQNLFFAERLLQRNAGGAMPMDGELLLVSYEMAVLTLQFWVHKDRFGAVTCDLTWLVMGYGAPAAGILCNELLRPTFNTMRHPRNPKITRSTIIQQLSLLVGFLGWVRPGAPNYELCASCRVIIQHVLDHSLNGGGLQSQQPEETQDQWLSEMLGQVPDTENLFFNFDLLDTYDWMRPDEMVTDSVHV